MLTTMRAGSLAIVSCLLVVGAACSLVNAPDDVKVGGGGAPATTTVQSGGGTGGDAGGGGGTGGGAGGGGGTGGASPACVHDDDCSTVALCREAPRCQNGACVDGGPALVDDGDACTVDSCDSTTGEIQHEPVVVDDGDLCTLDTCDPTTGVRHEPLADLDDGNACTLDQCDGTTNPPALTHTKLLGCGCAHSVCSEGGPLDVQGCSWARSDEGACVAKVCASNESCCTESWGPDCVDAVVALCGQDDGAGGGSSEGAIDCACAHSYCAKGIALKASCDPCVKEICAKKPACCDESLGAWTSDCVIATNTLCNAPPAPNCQ